MSTYAVVGILLSIPAGLTLQRLGYRITGLIALTWVSLGAGLGATAVDPVFLLLTRFMEGIGLNLLALVSPTILALHFEDRRRAVAVGIWSAWYPLGSTVTFLISPLLASFYGWRSVWWFGCLYAFAVGVLYFCFIRHGAQKIDVDDKTRQPAVTSTAGVKLTLRNPEVLVMTVLFFAAALVYVAYLTWTPTFLHRSRGVTLSFAASAFGLFSAAGIASSLLSGWFMSRSQSQRAVSVIVMMVFSILSLLTFFLPTGCILPVLFILGSIGAFIPSVCVSNAARLIHEKKVGPVALSMLTIGQNMESRGPHSIR